MNLDGLFTLSYGLYIVSSHKNGKPNGQISNAVMQVTDLPPQIAVAMNKTELTHEFISSTSAFTITVLSEQTPMKYIGRFGFKSGREIDKFAGIGFDLAETSCPYPTDYALAYLDLRLVYTFDVGTHTLFVGELVDSNLLGHGRPMTYAYYREVLRGKAPPTAPTYRALAPV